ncbi:MAG: MarR family transcriptional regulator [Pseudomonadota bacterium]
MRLTPVMQRYILHWGEMGARWGANRSVAQIHALLFLADRPMHAEEIVETLTIARSNVSTSLKELQGWGLVRLVHLAEDRRDHFEAKDDPWEMMMIIVEGRKKREIDPTLEMLKACVADADADAETPAAVKAKLRDMEAFVSKLDGWYAQVRQIPRPTLVKLLNLGGKVAGLLGR